MTEPGAHSGEAAEPVRIHLQACGCSAVVELQQSPVLELARKVFEPLLVTEEPSPRTLSISTSSHHAPHPGNDLILIRGDDVADGKSQTPGDVLFSIDKTLTVELQRQRPDLFFVHAAVLSFEGRALVLAASSGTGKSTAALALLANGLGYLSDELAPIDLVRLEVHPYPRALCLKGPPPAPYRLPGDVLRIDGKLHVPAALLAARVSLVPAPLGAFFFLSREGRAGEAPLRRLSVAAGATYLVANALNPLAHPARGMDAAIELATRVPCFQVDTIDLVSAVSAIRAVMAVGGQPG